MSVRRVELYEVRNSAALVGFEVRVQDPGEQPKTYQVGPDLRDHPLVYIDLEAKPGVLLAGQTPRIHTGLRTTATSSHRRNDILIFPASYASAAVGDPLRDGHPPLPEGLRLACTLELADSAGQLTLSFNALIRIRSPPAP